MVKNTQQVLDLVNAPETHTQKILDLHVPERHNIKVVSRTAYSRYSAWTLALDEAISGRANVAGACGMLWQAGSVGAGPVCQGVQSAINCWIGVVREAATLSRKHYWRYIIAGHLVTVCVARGSFLMLASQVGVGAIVQVAGLCARRVVGQGALQIGGCVCLVCLQACARCCVPGLRRAARGGLLGLIASYPEIATPLF